MQGKDVHSDELKMGLSLGRRPPPIKNILQNSGDLEFSEKNAVGGDSRKWNFDDVQLETE